MQPRKFKLGIARFPYAGNGATSSEIPEIGDWLFHAGRWLLECPEIERDVWLWRRADTPIPMVRNGAVLAAHHAGVDLLLMIDSDNAPDLYSQPPAVPFLSSSLAFIQKQYDRGPCIVLAPYCGPPPHPTRGGEECVYVFRWATISNNAPRGYRLQLYPREEAAQRAGFERVAAGPTGMILMDMRLFNFNQKEPDQTKVNPPWFAYEWNNDKVQATKASTEDCYFTRNASLAGIPVYCNWDCWVGHCKPQMVGKPIIIYSDHVSEVYRDAVLRGQKSDEKIVELNPDIPIEEIDEILGTDPSATGLPATGAGGAPVGDTGPAPDVGDSCEGAKGGDAPAPEQVYPPAESHVKTDEEDIESITQIVAAVAEQAGDRPITVLNIGLSEFYDRLAWLVGQRGGTVYAVGPITVVQRTAEVTQNTGIGSQDAAAFFTAQGILADLLFLPLESLDARTVLGQWRPLVRPGGVIAGTGSAADRRQLAGALGHVVNRGDIWFYVVPEQGLEKLPEEATASV
jgi:hypothetical protein